MDNRNRTLWIVIAIVVAVLLCCCVLVVGAAVTGLLATAPFSQEAGFGRVEERTEQVFTVGQAPTLEVESFAGDVVVRSGESGEMRIIITKKAMNSNALNRINVNLREDDDGVRVRASHPGVNTNMSIDFEILVPADARLDLDTSAGNVQVDDVRGEISAHTGAGNVRVQGAAAPVALDTGAGDVDYQGEPRGECAFSTGAGNVTLHLPADVDVEVRLDTGIGNISLDGFDVEGDVSATEVDGVIGTSEQTTIKAKTGAGNISLVRR